MTSSILPLPYPTHTGALRLGDISRHPKAPFHRLNAENVAVCTQRLRNGLGFDLPFTVQDTPGWPMLDGYVRYQAYKRAFPDDWMDRQVAVVFLTCADSEVPLAALEINTTHGVRFTQAEAIAALLLLGPAVLCPDGVPLREVIAACAARLNLPAKIAIQAVRREFVYRGPVSVPSRMIRPTAAFQAMTEQAAAPTTLPVVAGTALPAGPLPPSPTEHSVRTAIRDIDALIVALRTFPPHGAPGSLQPTLEALRRQTGSVLRGIKEIH